MGMQQVLFSRLRKYQFSLAEGGAALGTWKVQRVGRATLAGCGIRTSTPSGCTAPSQISTTTVGQETQMCITDA